MSVNEKKGQIAQGKGGCPFFFEGGGGGLRRSGGRLFVFVILGTTKIEIILSLSPTASRLPS